jgi:hypothetical protein
VRWPVSADDDPRACDVAIGKRRNEPAGLLDQDDPGREVLHGRATDLDTSPEPPGRDVREL